MIRTRSSCALALAGLALAALSGCADDAPAGPNPARLWLALDGNELQVRLSPVEPPEF